MKTMPAHPDRRSSCAELSVARGKRSRREGAILVVALGVLTLLAVLGATFAQLMSLEKRAMENYVDAQHMDHLTSSALDMVVAHLHDWSNRRSWLAYSNLPWLYQLKKEDDLAHGRAGIEDPRVGEWFVYSELGGKRFRFKTKIIDAASQINLNGRQDSLARMLDSLGQAIASSDRLKREREGQQLWNPFRTEPNGGNVVTGEQIINFRRRLEGQRFQSKSQLRQLISDENYEIVKDFLTCWSWEDPHTYGASDGENEVVDLLGGGLANVGGGRGLGGGDVQPQPDASDNPRLFPEPRHPININTAPEEVLTACLTRLAGRRIFPYSQLGINGGEVRTVDENATILGQRLPFGKEEFRNVTPRAVFVYSQAFDLQQARRIAQRIIQQRKHPNGTFRAWRTYDPRQPGFEDFIDSLETDFFPGPNTVTVIDPRNPRDTQIQAGITSAGASPIGLMWQRGSGQGVERNLLRGFGLAAHDSHAWYYDMVKSVLKANFNPNTRSNRYNPNAPAYVPVDKSDLVLAEKTRDRLLKGYTTEFCFDSMGIFEITTLGEIFDLSKLKVGPRASGVDSSPEVYPFRRKIRTVVKVFDVLRHTSQFHFEKTFKSGSRSSAQDRRYVVTWPEPMEALTELHTQGANRDGRVELAGLLDGQRFEIPLRNRQVSFSGKHPSVIMEHSFTMRDQQSISRLRRASRTGGINSVVGSQITDALRDVLDADYSRYRSTYREYYRESRMKGLGVFSGQAEWNDPLVGKEPVGMDLLPDGLNTSILRVPHVGSRLLVLPARQRIGEAGAGGTGNTQVGASGLAMRGQNIVGNVPYYRGGLGFWVKFEFDGDDPVFSGLIGCTEVIREVLPNPQEYSGSEGTQFFIFKNTVGQLRIVRLYYHQAFPQTTGEGGSDGGAGVGASGQLYPQSATGEGGGEEAGGRDPILENLDPQKWISRSDILVDVSHFKAHEWHHLAIDWDDQNPTRPIRLYLDFEEDQSTVVMPQQVVDGTANSWVRLNERQPKDGLQIAGIVRAQQVEDAGIFKWYTNTTTGPGGVGVIPVGRTIKRMLANATIDDLITYEGSFLSAKSYYGGRGQPGYFTNQVGEYANIFEVPLPPEVNQVTLRSFDWTSYYPTVYTDSRANSVARPLQVNPVECELVFNGPVLARRTPEPWRQPTVENFAAGKIVYRSDVGIRGDNAEVVYKFRMTGGRSPTGNTAGGVVQTPVIDDVTLTYFLPSPKILLQEEVPQYYRTR